jgi:hypothetical protein
MKTTIELPDALARQAREVAREHHLSLKELVTEGLRAEIERLSSSTPHPEFHFRTVPGQGLEPGVAPQSLTDRAYDLPS